jgi:hypothetical protein
MRSNSNDKFRLWASGIADHSVSFLSFVMFTFLGTDAEHGLSVADCIEEESCVRVLKNFCISCTCIMKAMSIAVTCQASRSTC